jgi:class 3 adenylate cyclase
MPEPGDGAPARRRRKLSAIMMADVSGFSRMMGANEESTVDLIKDFHDRVQRLVTQFEGRIVDTAGDSVFGEFDSVVNAVTCSWKIQQEQAATNRGREPADRVHTRIGVHLGDVIVEDYRVYGDGVNIAARLEPLADPGGICISEAVYQQIRNKLDLPIEDGGLRELKNIEHSVRIYKVAPVEPSAAVPAPERPRGPRRPLGDDAAPVASPFDELARPHAVVPLTIGLFLLVSPVFFFSTGGVFPTAGAILTSVVLGRAWARTSGRRGRLLISLGAGIACGALFTQWSVVTDALFVLGGLVVAAVGVGQRHPERARR